jgi:hypothetical protein
MSKHISVTCGIYPTRYTLINRKDGTIDVKVPYIKWDNNNTGRLAFSVEPVHPAAKPLY